MGGRFSCIVLLWLVFFGFIQAKPVEAYESAYMPLDSRLLSRRVHQELVADPLEPRGVIRYGSTRIEIVAVPRNARRLPSPLADMPVLSIHGVAIVFFFERGGNYWLKTCGGWLWGTLQREFP